MAEGYMSELSIQFEWEDPLGAKGPELRATWARLSILVEGNPVTRVFDKRSRGVRDSVYGPLYPLAEWIATHWWALVSEVETPGIERELSYPQRHDLAHGREGFALPSVVLAPCGQQTRISWTGQDFPDAGVRFLDAGTCFAPSAGVRNECARFVSAVCARLEDEGVHDTSLQKEWEAIQRCDAAERAFCEAAAALGLDPYALDERDRSRLMDACAAVPAELTGEFLGAVDFGVIGDAVNQLLSSMHQIAQSTLRLPTLEDLRRKHLRPDHALPPWQQGHVFAMKLRAELGVGASILPGMSGVAGALGMDTAVLLQAILYPRNQNLFLDALVGSNGEGSPVFVINKRREDSRQFALCRALYEYLTAPGRLSIVSKTRSERQRANRAFAAEFLAPETTLRQRLRGPTVDDEQIDDLASEFGVSCFVIRHQIENHHLATIEAA